MQTAANATRCLRWVCLTLLLGAALVAQPAAAVKGISDWSSGLITHFGGAQDGEESLGRLQVLGFEWVVVAAAVMLAPCTNTPIENSNAGVGHLCAGMDPSSPSFGTKEGACGYGMIPKQQVCTMLCHAAHKEAGLHDPMHERCLAPAHICHQPLPCRATPQYPYFSTAALSPSNKFFKADPMGGCGQCFQIQCVDKRSGEEPISAARLCMHACARRCACTTIHVALIQPHACLCP